jgi:hypothetical protein
MWLWLFACVAALCAAARLIFRHGRIGPATEVADVGPRS